MQPCYGTTLLSNKTGGDDEVHYADEESESDIADRSSIGKL